MKLLLLRPKAKRRYKRAVQAPGEVGTDRHIRTQDAQRDSLLECVPDGRGRICRRPLELTSTPVTGCNSGTNCWKTDLTGNYNAGSNQSLLSPNMSLTGLTKPITVSWAQKYQIENAAFDTFFVEVREPGPVNARSLFRHYDATMQDFVGSPSTALNESAGWGLVSRRIDAYAEITRRFGND